MSDNKEKIPADFDPDEREKALLTITANETGIWYLPFCMEMCPTLEADMRTKSNQVHVLEQTPSGIKLVKSFSWTVANPTKRPRQLRPFVILYRTVHHLLMEVPKRLQSDFNVQIYDNSVVQHFKKLPIMYDFLNDRLEAVRLDMEKQNLIPEECALLLEPMIRFYIYFSFRLTGYPNKEFDQQQLRQVIRDCIGWFLKCCDALRKESEDIDNAIDYYRDPELGMRCNTNLIESLHILLNLGNTECLHRYLSLPKSTRKAPAMKLAYDIAVANANGHFVTVHKLGKKLCPLNLYALCLHLPDIQKRGLYTLSHGFHKRAVPVHQVNVWLKFNSYETVMNTCEFYGQQVVREESKIIFNKHNFKADEQHVLYSQYPAIPWCIMTVKDILTYTI